MQKNMCASLIANDRTGKYEFHERFRQIIDGFGLILDMMLRSGQIGRGQTIKAHQPDSNFSK